MSWRLTELVKERAPYGPGAELWMLMMMANYAADDGSAIFPTIPTLAKLCRISERQTQRTLAKLRDAGFIERTIKRHNGAWEYRIIVENLQRLPTVFERGDIAMSPDEGVTQPRHRMGDIAASPVRGDIAVSPINVNTQTSEQTSPSASPAAKRVSYPKAFESWWTEYGKRGSKYEALRVWEKLSVPDRALAMRGIANYMASENPQKGYVVDGSRYLRGRHWEVEPGNGHRPAADLAATEVEQARLKRVRELGGRSEPVDEAR